MHDILLSGNRREFPVYQDCGFQILQYGLPFHPAFRGGAAVKRSESRMRAVPAGREDEDVSGTGDAVELLVGSLPTVMRIYTADGKKI